VPEPKSPGSAGAKRYLEKLLGVLPKPGGSRQKTGILITTSKIPQASYDRYVVDVFAVPGRKPARPGVYVNQAMLDAGRAEISV